MGTQGRFATAADGTRLRYELRGTGSSKRIALVHSLALNAEVWDEVGEQLVADPRAQVLTMDCRGHGHSDKPVGPYSVELMAADLATVMNAVGWARAVVGGASMGGNVAQAFAVGYPRRVTALALIDTTAWYGPDAAKNWADRADKARQGGLAALVDFQLTRWFSEEFREARPDLANRFRDVFVANDIDAYVASCQMMGAFDLRAAIRTIRVPTAVAVGESDFATPLAMAEVIHDSIKGSSLDIIPGAYHLTPVERSDLVAALIGDVSSRAASAGSGT